MRWFPFRIGRDDAISGTGGISSRNGFRVSITSLGDFCTPGFSLDDGSEKAVDLIRIIGKLFYVVSMMGLMVNVLIYPPDYSLGKIAWLLLTIVTLNNFIVSTSTLIPLSFDKQTREWHACEHKAIELIASGKDATYENLASQHMVSIHCGTAGIVMSNQLLMTAWGVGTCLYWLSDDYAAICISILFLFFGSCLSLIILKDFAEYLRPSSLEYLVALPASIFPYLVERFFALKEPPREKMLIALEVVKNIRSAPGFNEFFYERRVKDTLNCE